MAERGWVVLPPLAPERAAAVLSPPSLPPTAAGRVTLVRDAARLRVPILIRAPAGSRLLLARAVHALGAPSGPLVTFGGRRPALATAPPAHALLVDVGALAPEAALVVEALLDDGDRWLLAVAEPGVDLPPALVTRLAPVVLDVPPLAARADDLPALAGAALATLARRAGAEAPSLRSDAIARLAAHSWPGDVAELEAVLARAWLVAGGGDIDAEHLALETAPPVPAASAPGAAGDPALELLLAELAHEVRNPLVTVKTFAEHLPDLLEDATLRERFATLTREGIDRIDALLENVIEFARLGPPRSEPIALGPLLDRLLAEVEPELAGRAVRVRRGGEAGARCTGDPDQLAYALRNLFAGVVREVPPREELALDASVNGVVTVRFAAGGDAAAHLRRFAGGDDGALSDPTLLPLAFRLARTVLERNGGGLAVLPEAGSTTTVVVRLPNAEGG